MAESFSSVILVGALRQPVHVEALPRGSQCGTFDLILREKTSTGQWFSTVVPCQIWGRHLDAARRVQPGQACLFQGKLARRKKGEAWELCVSGFALEPLELPAAPFPAPPSASSVSRN
jgi:hypothetical protein